MSSRDAIDARVKDFVADLELLVRAAALEAVQAALGGGAPPSRAPARKRGRPAKVAAPAKAAPTKAAAPPPAPEPVKVAPEPVKVAPEPAKAPKPAKAAKAAKAAKPAKPAKAAKAAKPAKAAKAAGGKRKKGQKRTKAELAAVQAKLEAFVRANDGKRIEEISRGLSIPTGDLTRPMKKLMEDGKVRSTGERRATRYYAAKKK